MRGFQLHQWKTCVTSHHEPHSTSAIKVPPAIQSIERHFLFCCEISGVVLCCGLASTSSRSSGIGDLLLKVDNVCSFFTLPYLQLAFQIFLNFDPRFTCKSLLSRQVTAQPCAYSGVLRVGRNKLATPEQGQTYRGIGGKWHRGILTFSYGRKRRP